MSTAAEQVRDAFYRLPIEERTQLAQEFWEHKDNFELTDEQKEIVLAELAEHDRDPNGGISWDELKAELQAKVIR